VKKEPFAKNTGMMHVTKKPSKTAHIIARRQTGVFLAG
jgi:hypothetical protein